MKSKSEKTSAWERTGVRGLLRHRKSRRYYWRVKISGKQKWQALGTDSFAVAKLRLAEKAAHLERSRGAITRADSGVATMGDLLKVYVTQVEGNAGLTPRTRQRYVELARFLEKTWPGFATLPPARVTKEAIETWRNNCSVHGTGYVPPGAKNGARTKGNSAATINKGIDTLRRLLALAYDRGMISRNPASGRGVKLKHQPRKPALPSVAKIQAIFSEVEKASGIMGREIADFLRFLAFSGCRLNEAGAVTWEDVDFVKGVLRIRGTKTETADRAIPLNPDLRSLLEGVRERRERAATHAVEGRPYVDPSARVLAVREGAKSLRRACEELRLPVLTHHDLRDVFGTTCIEAGVDIPTVAGWLGHKDGGALLMKVYSHLRAEHSAQAAARVSFGARKGAK